MVRVDATGGAPRLVVNGEPVRARMFYGAPGAAPLPIAPAGREVSFEFVASGSASNGTMHFRFGNTPGDIYLDDIRVVDVDEKREVLAQGDFEAESSFQQNWTFWPTGGQNTVGSVEVGQNSGRNSAGLHVRLRKPPEGKWPDFHIYHHTRLRLVQGHHYQVSFWARAEPARKLTVAFYRPGQSYTRLGGPPDLFEQQIKLAAEAGVNFVSFPIATPWPKPGVEVDWASVDAACEAVLQANPKALLVPRIGMGPPAWWRQAHPEHVMLWEDGHRDKTVVASAQYRRDAAEVLAGLVRHLEEKFGEHVAGYHPCGQNTGEWFYEDTWKRPLNGYALADVAAWREWVAQRYGSDAVLRKSWNDPAANIKAAITPSANERHAAPTGIFREPATAQKLIDWNEFQQEAMADCVCALARAVRQASQGRKLVLFFYGYVFEFGTIQNDPATCGHYALRRVLNSPDVDMLCSPISYFDRGLGQSAPSMTAAESVALAGKMWLNEDDTHTFLASEDFPGSRDHVASVEETNAQLVRNVAQEALRNFGTWWMDLGASGWFNDARMWTEMKRLRALDEPLLQTRTPFQPEVAAVIDEASMMRVAAGGLAVTRPGIYEVRAPLGRMGAPYGQYLLDDVLAGRVRAKLYVFVNAWSLSADQRNKLLQATRGAARLWCYAPGYFEGNRIAPEAMRELTGFALKSVPGWARATPTDAGKGLGIAQSFGIEKAVRPLFAVTDAAPSEVLATYPDGSAAVVMRERPDGCTAFVGVPGLTSELLRAVARKAGVHLFTESDCNVYANGQFVALHASQNGPLAVNFREANQVGDVLTGAKLGNAPKLTINLKRGETRIYRVGE